MIPVLDMLLKVVTAMIKMMQFILLKQRSVTQLTMIAMEVLMKVFQLKLIMLMRMVMDLVLEMQLFPALILVLDIQIIMLTVTMATPPLILQQRKSVMELMITVMDSLISLISY